MALTPEAMKTPKNPWPPCETCACSSPPSEWKRLSLCPTWKLCFPALSLMRFILTPSLALSMYVYVCGSAAIPCVSPLFSAPVHIPIPCRFAEGVLCPSFLGAGECLELWDGPWSPIWLRCSWVFSCWLQLCDSDLASFPGQLPFCSWSSGHLSFQVSPVVGDLSRKLSWSQRTFSGPFNFHQSPPGVGYALPLINICSLIKIYQN